MPPLIIPRPLLLLLLPTLLFVRTCLCIAPYFMEELAQLQEEQGLPSCLHDNPQLRTWTFPVAGHDAGGGGSGSGSGGGGGMVWAAWLGMAGPQPFEKWSGNETARDGQAPPLPAQQHFALAISSPLSDSSFSVASADMRQGAAVLQVDARAC
jgi:hypothetical protein